MSDRGTYRAIHTVLVDGPDFQALTPHGRLVLLVAKLSLGPSGIDVLYSSGLAERTGLTPRQIRAAVVELQQHDWLRVDGNVMWIVRGLEFEPTFRLSNTNHRHALAEHLAGLPHRPIVAEYRSHYAAWFVAPNATGMPSPIPSASHVDAMSMASPPNAIDMAYPMAYPMVSTSGERIEDRTTTTTTPLRGRAARVAASAKPEKTRPNWVARFAAEWQNKRDGVLKHGRLGDAIKPLVEQRGEDVVFAAWCRFLASPSAQFGAEWFAANAGDYLSVPSATRREADGTEIAPGCLSRQEAELQLDRQLQQQGAAP